MRTASKCSAWTERAPCCHAHRILLATGSRPRHVPAIQVDHEHILDSDSILSLPYLPRTLIVFGKRRHRLRIRLDFRGAGLHRDLGGQGS